jgi:hypothetical protein
MEPTCLARYTLIRDRGHAASTYGHRERRHHFVLIRAALRAVRCSGQQKACRAAYQTVQGRNDVGIRSCDIEPADACTKVSFSSIGHTLGYWFSYVVA